LVIYVNDANGQPGGKVTVLDQLDPKPDSSLFYQAHQPLAQLVFSDGVVWTQSDIEARLLAQEESQGGDGGVIYGFDAPTPLTAGSATEVLIGISGNDTYVWAAGDGSTVVDEQATQPGVNTLLLKGVAPADVTVSDDPTPGNNNLVLTIPGQNPIVLENQIGVSQGNMIDQVMFDD